MRPIHVSVIAGLSVAMFGAANAELEGSVHVGINTEYIWRGTDQMFGEGSNSMFEAGLDLSVATIAGWDLGVGMWYASVHGTDGFDEIDYFASASRDFRCFSAAIGYTYYDFPSTSGGVPLTQEMSFGLSTDVRGWFTAGLTYYWAVEGDNDGYTELTFDRTFVLCEAATLDLGSTHSFDTETSEVHHHGLSAMINYAVNDVLTVSPYVSLTIAEDGSQKYNSANGFVSNDDEIFAGFLVSAEF
jgi:hypothetical protein